MASEQDRQLVAQGGAGGGDGTPAEGKKRMAGKQLVLFIILPAVLLLGGGATAFFMLSNKPDEAAAAKSGKADKKAKETKEAKKGDKGGEKKSNNEPQVSEGPSGEGYLTLPDMVVNISTADSKPAYLKLKLTLQAKDVETVEAVEAALPRVMDQYNGFLRELRMEDVAGSAGYSRLQMELLKRVNLAIAPAQIDAVLIEEMLVQ
jgi:flagellar protein FliL